MGKHYKPELKEKILSDYKTGKYGGYAKVAEKYGISHGTLSNWIYKENRQGNLDNDIYKTRGRKKDENIDYKERYEILKKYQAFLKAQREKR